MPGLLGLVGATGAGLALAPALRVLTYPLLALTVFLLGRGWYLVARGRGRRTTLWGRRSRLVLAVSTVVAVVVWGLRFAGLLGMPPPWG